MAKSPLAGGFFDFQKAPLPALWDRAENAIENRGTGAQAQQGRDRGPDRRPAGRARRLEGGVYEDASTGRWFVVLRPPGRSKTTTRRRAVDGSQLHTRDQALAAREQWQARLAGGEAPVGRERFESYWARYLRHARAPGASSSTAAPRRWPSRRGRQATASPTRSS
jgi:hypothetical protein